MSSVSIFRSIKSEIQSTLSLGVPLVASQLIYACSGFIGTAMIARLGQDALAASVLVNTTWMSLSILFFGLLNSVSVLVSHQYGAKNYKAISEIMGQALLLAIVLCVVIVLLLFSTTLLLPITHQPATVILLAKHYMYSLILTIPALIVLVIYEQFLAGINQTKLVLRISLLVVPIEIPLIYLLIFGKWGLPECGVAGIGYGFAITYSVTAIGLVCYLLKAKYYQKFEILNAVTPIHCQWIKELIRIGLPMGCMHTIEVTTFAVATFWIARFGTTLLAAHQIVLQYLGFAITLVFAMSQAVTIRVGHAVGRQDLPSIYYAIYVGLAIDSFCMALLAIAFYLFPYFFIHFDVNTLEPSNTFLVTHTASLLGICGLLMLFDNFRIIGFGALRGLKDTKFPMYVSFISFWLIGLTAAFYLGFILKFAAKGIWWGLTFGVASGALFVLIRLYWLLKRIDLVNLLKIQ